LICLIQLLFLLLFLLLALLQKLVSTLASCQEIEMKGDKIEQQEAENAHHERTNPRKNNPEQLVPILIVNVNSADGYMDDEQHGVGKGGEYADKERAIVALADTVVEPHAVVVEVVDAAIAGATMFAPDAAVAVAEFAV
jgi:hypothetical protein